MTGKRIKLDHAEAAAAIDDFAKKMLQLTGGRSLPRAWKQCLLLALVPPKQRTVGRKRNLVRYQAIVEDLVSLTPEQRGEFTKHNNPADHYRDIAQRHGVSPKTVARIDRDARTYEDIDRLDPARRSARIEAIAAVLTNRISAKVDSPLAKVAIKRNSQKDPRETK